MLSPVDYRTAITLVGSVGSAAAVVATLKADIRWIRRWMSDHKREDAQNFRDLRNELAELRRSSIQRPPEFVK